MNSNLKLLRKQADTRESLPPVSLVLSLAESDMGDTHFRLNSFGRKVGTLALHQAETEDAYYVYGMQVEMPWRGQGMGLAALLAAAAHCHDQGVFLASDPNGICAGELPLWEHLIETGVATDEIPLQKLRAQGCHGEAFGGRIAIYPADAQLAPVIPLFPSGSPL